MGGEHTGPLSYIPYQFKWGGAGRMVDGLEFLDPQGLHPGLGDVSRVLTADRPPPGTKLLWCPGNTLYIFHGGA